MTMDVVEAIKTRRSIRRFTQEGVSKTTIHELIEAAIQAPSSMNAQPWSFAVLQDRAILDAISQQTKEYLLDTMEQRPMLEKYRDLFENPQYDIFYGATTLLIVCGKVEFPKTEIDCALAAQNIMLSAHAMDLGTCWIGFAKVFLNTPHIKEVLGIPATYTVVAPLVVGHPAAANSSVVSRKEPEIIVWK